MQDAQQRSQDDTLYLLSCLGVCANDVQSSLCFQCFLHSKRAKLLLRKPALHQSKEKRDGASNSVTRNRTVDFITASFTTSYSRSSDKTHHHQTDTRLWHNIGSFPSVTAESWAPCGVCEEDFFVWSDGASYIISANTKTMSFILPYVGLKTTPVLSSYFSHIFLAWTITSVTFTLKVLGDCRIFVTIRPLNQWYLKSPQRREPVALAGYNIEPSYKRMAYSPWNRKFRKSIQFIELCLLCVTALLRCDTRVLESSTVNRTWKLAGIL